MAIEMWKILEGFFNKFGNLIYCKWRKSIITDLVTKIWVGVLLELGREDSTKGMVKMRKIDWDIFFHFIPTIMFFRLQCTSAPL